MRSVVFLLILISQAESRMSLETNHVDNRRQVPTGHTVSLHYLTFNMYVAKIELGTPPEEFLFVMDTGSCGVWVASTKSPQNDFVFNKKFDATKSETCVAVSSTFSLEYINGAVEGTLSRDLFKIGDIELTDFVFGEAVHYSGWVNSRRFHGILGLQPNSVYDETYQTFVGSLLEEKLIANEVFTFHYCRNSHQDGEITFGCQPEDYFGCKITYLDLTDSFSWKISIPRILFDGTVLCKNCPVVVDSGQSLNIAPESQTRSINSQFSVVNEKRGLFGLNCAQKSKTRPVTVVFSEEAAVTFDDYFLEAKYPNFTACFSAFSFNQAVEHWVFGVDILQKLFTVFDASKQRIGFAKSQC